VEICVITIVSNLESDPILTTFSPVGKLAELNQCVTVTSPVVEAVPVNKDTDGGDTHIGTNDEVTSEDPRSNNSFITKILEQNITIFTVF